MDYAVGGKPLRLAVLPKLQMAGRDALESGTFTTSDGPGTE
jgi:hypothetical protein